MPIRVRPADPTDAALVAEFNCRLAEESEGKALELRRIGPGVAALLADPIKGVYYLAESEDGVVGQLSITREWSDWRNGWFWWIQSVYVRADARRQGVFRLLYDHVAEAAADAGNVVGIRLYVERENARAIQTYLAMGMQETNYRILERCPLT